MYLQILCFSYTPYFINIFCFRVVNLYGFWLHYCGMGLINWFLDAVDDLWDAWISRKGFVDFMFIVMCFLFKGFRPYFQMKLYRIFGRFSRVRIFWISGCHASLGIRFSNGFSISMNALRVIGKCFKKSRSIHGHTTVVICSTFGSGRDNIG